MIYAKPAKSQLIAGLLYAALVFFCILIFSPGTVQAAPCWSNRYSCNDAEWVTHQECDASPGNVIGSIWFNNTGATTTDDGYYAATVNVSGSTNSVSVTIRGSVYDCGTGGISGNVWATGVAPRGPNAWRLTGQNTTTLYRGAYTGNWQWTTQGDSISATLDVSNLPSGNVAGTQSFVIDLFRCYSSNGSSATGTCYAQPITVTVVRTNVNANYQPSSDANGTSVPATVYGDPNATANFRVWNYISNYGGANHAIAGTAQMKVGSTGAWQNIHQGSYLATGNGNTFFWTQNGVGPGTTVNGSLLGAGYVVPANTDEICFRLQITDSGGAVLSGGPNPSAPSCLRIRGGNTYANASSTNNYIEAGQSSDILGQIITNAYSSWGGDPAANYFADCSYTITITPGAGAGSNNGALAGGPTGGSCDQTISGIGTLVPVTRTYSAGPNTRIGSQACIAITVTVPPGLGGATNASACITVVAKPYFKAFAGDVRAGCNANGAIISGWNQGANAFAGAGGAFAAFALGNITEFPSAQGGINAAGFAAVAKGLTFASNDASTYGGNFSSGACVLDYLGARPTVSVPTNVLVKNIPDASFNALDYMSANSDGGTQPGIRQAFYSNGDLTVTGGGLSTGANATVYVDGDVYISGDITVASAGGVAAYVPRLTIVACGNIAIAPAVSRLDAVLIAQAQTDGANCDASMPNGQIYTCGTNTFGLYQVTAANYGTCSATRLTVNGSLIANKIFFTRTSGTAARHGTAAADFLRGGNGAGGAAELIQYNPLNWVQLSETGYISPGTIRYDAITTLPPVL